MYNNCYVTWSQRIKCLGEKLKEAQIMLNLYKKKKRIERNLAGT